MQKILKHIASLTTKLVAMQPLSAENNERLQKKLRLEFNYNSNHIEGNTLTYGETELLLIFEKTNGNHEIREYEEMQSHDAAFKLIKEWAGEKGRPLSEADIKNINKLILVKRFWKEALTADGQTTRKLIKIGDYKEYPNSVRLQNGEIFQYPSPAETPILMGELMDWWRSEEETKELHPLILAASLHYKFVRIHPFDDGNGRIARLLMNYVLLKNDLPPVIIKSNDKKNYLFALNQADTGNLDAFIEYIAEQLIWSLEISIKAANGEKVDEMGDVDKKLHLLKKKLGEEGNEKVKIKFGWDALKDIVDNSVMNLCIAWENKLENFDSLFYSREVKINFYNKLFEGEELDTLLDVIMNTQLKNYIEVTSTPQINLNIYPIGLRSLNEDTISFSGGPYPVAWLLHINCKAQ